jgi:hypothetical protein
MDVKKAVGKFLNTVRHGTYNIGSFEYVWKSPIFC